MAREKLISLLGDRPVVKEPEHLLIKKETNDTYTVETLLLDLNGEEKVPAYFIKPKNVQGPLPLMLFHHSHDSNYGLGRKEVIEGNDYLQSTSFAKELTNLGYAVLAIDAWGFNERSGKRESEIFKEMLVKGQVLWGMMLFDNMSAIDYAVTRDDVDSNRIGNIGMSMGGMTAWWLAALDERVKVSVDIGGQVDLETLIDERLLDKHNFYFYVPALLKHFTTPEVQELIAPRKRLSLVGRYDMNCPLHGVEKLEKHLNKVYADAGYPDHFKQVVTTGGHQETSHMRAEWKAFLIEHL